MDFSFCRDDSSNSDINISAALPSLGLRHGRSDRTPIGFAKIADLGLAWRGEHVFARVSKLRHGLQNLQLANAGKRVGNLGRHKLARKRKELTVFDELVTEAGLLAFSRTLHNHTRERALLWPRAGVKDAEGVDALQIWQFGREADAVGALQQLNGFATQFRVLSGCWNGGKKNERKDLQDCFHLSPQKMAGDWMPLARISVLTTTADP